MTEKLPKYQFDGMRVVGPEMYGNLVAATTRTTGLSGEEAEAVADAVLSTLSLVPPAPRKELLVLCDHVYFSDEGEWHLCEKDHAQEDEDEDDGHGHRSENDKTWRDDQNDPRALHWNQLS